ncbi:MAG TPA: ABC transporter ATP-binding protein [Gaiellaceae bacterium]
MRIETDGLTVTYPSATAPVVRDVSLSVSAGETLGIVGTTGSGKSTIALSMLRLLPPGATLSGRILVNGTDIVTLPTSRLREIRGKTIGYVFQDSLASLNPVLTVRSQVAETLRRHDRSLSHKDAREKAEIALDELGIPSKFFRCHPHEFSGGMRQRAMIATALAPSPSFLIADESTSELDAPMQRMVLDLLAEIQRTRELGLMVISHDLAVINHLCERVAVLAHGDLVEYGATRDVLGSPTSPYTRDLIRMSAKAMTSDGRLYTAKQYRLAAAEAS